MEALSSGQRTRFEKGTRTDPLYLLDISYNVEVKEMVWSICGSTRNIYTVSLKNRKLWCNCPDMKSHCMAQGLVCKHVVFALWKVGKYRTWSYFDTRTIDDTGYEFLLNSALERDALFSDRTIVDADLVGQFERLALNRGSNGGANINPTASIVDDPEGRPIDETDECPICYDVLLNKTTLDFCRTCSNSVHKECLKKWFQFNNTCVYCRSKWIVASNPVFVSKKSAGMDYEHL